MISWKFGLIFCFIILVEFSHAQELDSNLIVWKAKFDYGLIEDCLVTNDNKYVLVSTQNPAKLLEVDITNGEIIREFKNNYGVQSKIKISPDGKKVITKVDSISIIIWDYETGDTLQKIDTGNDYEGFVDYDLYPDASHIIVGIDKHSIFENTLYFLVVDLNTYDKEYITGGIIGDSVLTGIKLSNDGKRLITCTLWWDDYQQAIVNSTMIWEYPSMNYIYDFKYDHLASELRLVFTSDDKYIFFAGWAYIIIYDNYSYQKIKTLPYLTYYYYLEQMEMTSDNNFLILTYLDKIIIWDLENEKEIYKYAVNGSIASSITKDDGYIAVGIYSQLYLLKLNTKPISVYDISVNHTNLRIIPNPTSGKTVVTILPESSGYFNIEVYNSIGIKSLGLGNHFLNEENNVLQYDFTNLPAGNYYLIISNGINSYRNKFIVIH